MLRDSVVDGIAIHAEGKEVEAMGLVADIQAIVGVVVLIILLSSRDLTPVKKFYYGKPTAQVLSGR